MDRHDLVLPGVDSPMTKKQIRKQITIQTPQANRGNLGEET